MEFVALRRSVHVLDLVLRWAKEMITDQELNQYRNLLESYCDLCDTVATKIVFGFSGMNSTTLSMELIGRGKSGSAAILQVTFEGVQAWRYQSGLREEGSVFTEGFRLAKDGGYILVDFGGDPCVIPGEEGWMKASDRWLICEVIRIDERAYTPEGRTTE